MVHCARAATTTEATTRAATSAGWSPWRWRSSRAAMAGLRRLFGPEARPPASGLDALRTVRWALATNSGASIRQDAYRPAHAGRQHPWCKQVVRAGQRALLQSCPRPGSLVRLTGGRHHPRRGAGVEPAPEPAVSSGSGRLRIHSSHPRRIVHQACITALVLVLYDHSSRLASSREHPERPPC